MSTHLAAPYALRALRAGAAGYLVKTEKPANVIKAIRQIHAGQTYVSPPVTRILAARIRPRAETDKQPHERLTDREFQIMLQLAGGRSTREVAEALSLSQSTVRTHRQHIFSKMGLENEVELALYVERTQRSGRR